MLTKIADNILLFLLKYSFISLRSRYMQKHGEKLLTIIVTGTVGKSSTTMLISQLFENAGYTVITGTSATKNYNTFWGYAKVLTNTNDNISGIKGVLVRAKIYFKLIATILIPTDYQKETIWVWELGIDTQDEIAKYLPLFKSVDTLVVTAATLEHSQGFTAQINQPLLDILTPYLPDRWLRGILKETSNHVANMALENLALLPYSNHSIIPSRVGELSDKILYKDKETWNEKSGLFIQNGFSFTFEDFTLDNRYIFPQTFAATLVTLRHIAHIYNLDKVHLDNTLHTIDLPLGRFGLFEGLNSSKIIDSTYNSDPAALGSFLDILEFVLDNPEQFSNPKEHVVILGEMRELGDDTEHEHKLILERLNMMIARYGAELFRIYLVGKSWKMIANKYEWHLNYMSLNISLKAVRFMPNTFFWLKGSQNTIYLEEAIKPLLNNIEDTKRLTRQEEHWMTAKSSFENNFKKV
jgi:UDP-N-acetylmuramyl pentapeptide synthase